MSYIPNLKMNEARLARVASMKEAILKTAITAAEATQANDGQLHVKVSSPIYWDQAYMPPGLTPEGLELAEIHKLDHSAAAVRAHGELAFDRMSSDKELRKVNTVISNGPGTDVVSTTYRQFVTHNPHKPEEKVIIHGHTNVALRMVGVAGTSDIGKSKAAIVERFSKGFENA